MCQRGMFFMMTILAAAILAACGKGSSTDNGNEADGNDSDRADYESFQARVEGSCDPGGAIRVINADGSVECQAVDQDIGLPECSDGQVLSWDGAEWACSSDFQALVTDSCGPNGAIGGINPDGSVECVALEDGIELPECADGEVLISDSGVFVCGSVALTTGAGLLLEDETVSLAPCASGEVWRATSDGWVCDDLSFIAGTLQVGDIVAAEGLQAGDSIVTSGEVVASGDVVTGGSVEVAGDVQTEGTVRIGGDSALCEESSAGSLRFHSGLRVMEYCNGSDWIAMGPTPLIGKGTLDAPYTLADGSATSSCRDYREKSASLNPGHGVYEVEPLGDGNAFPVYCDMRADGGGWTLVAVSADGGTEWSWNNRSYLTTDRTTFGNLHLLSDPDTMAFLGNYKNLALHDLPIQDVKIRWSSSENTVWASYHGVGDGSETLSQIIEAQQPAACQPHNRGYPMIAGTFTGFVGTGEETGYCGTRLYFNLIDIDGDSNRCGTIPRNNDAFGPSFNFRNNDGTCTTGTDGPFDDPGYQGFGPDRMSPATQVGAVSNMGSSFSSLNIGTARRTMLMYVR